MAEFFFLKNPLSKKWVIQALRRAKRPDIAQGKEPPCPFCPGNEMQDKEFYRLGGEAGDSNWEVRVIPNKYPFSPFHELVLNTRDHHTTFVNFTPDHLSKVLQVYKHRFNEHHHQGQVYIFHNHGAKAGESIPHSHTQITVIPDKVLLELPRLESVISDAYQGIESSEFTIFCPQTSQWSDEVWIAPKQGGKLFGEITPEETADLAKVMISLLTIFDLRYNKDFPFNFYIYPDKGWYLRIIPRLKTLGGFEVGTNVFVNTQNPKETADFIKEHFHSPQIEKIMKEHQAEYHPMV